jgi:hypothetical protein
MFKVSYNDFVDDCIANIKIHEIKTIWKRSKKLIDENINDTILKDWEYKSSWMEMSKLLIKKLRGKFNIPNDATNAFFKAVELYNFMNMSGPIRLFDNASLPGDFIRAAKWKFGHDVDWKANSLVGGLNDRFGLLRDNPEKWMMSKTMNGDITVAHNLDKMVIQLHNWRPNIYTSDLGFGVTDYYKEEEEHFVAHSAQVEFGLRILEPGGIFIVKTFTMFNKETLNLLNNTMRQFKEFWIVKPLSSKKDNSECYWVGKGYQPELNIPDSPKLYTKTVLIAISVLTLNQADKIKKNITSYKQCKKIDHRKSVNNWINTNLNCS